MSTQTTTTDTTRDRLIALSRDLKALAPHLSEDTQMDTRMALLCLHSAVNEATYRSAPQPRCQPRAAQLLRTLCGDPRQ